MRAHLDKLARGGFHIRLIFNGQSGQNLGLGNVWRDDAGALEQFRRNEFDS